MNKVNITVKKEIKVDGRTNNTGRPVNKKSARQIRLNKQALYAKLNNAFVSGKKFKINNDTNTYAYHTADNGHGYISNGMTHVCNVEYIGRTKVLGYTFVMGRKINIKLNLKNVTF